MLQASAYIYSPIPPPLGHPETLIHISQLDQHTPGGCGLELSNVID
jgi:hypothetical protein